MVFLELGQAVWTHATHAADVLVVVTGKLAPTPAPKEINTDGLISFFASKVAPILLAVLGVIFIGRASKGEVSKVLTSSAIARSEEHTSELQSQSNLVCRLLL